MKSGAALYAVTNRHNLDLSFKDRKYVGFTLGDVKISGYSETDHYYETIPTEPVQFLFATNPAEDVAVLDLTDRKMQFMRRRKQGETAGAALGPPSLMNLDVGMLATGDDLKKLAPGAPILMPSYSLLYDKSSERPVMRGGIVSSDPESDYHSESQEPARRVLFQAQSAEGASGAPVFAQLAGEAVLLGVNAGQLIIGGMPSGFSYCFKAQCIRECIDRWAR
ncbi:hypothetical protein KIP88_38020 [Bradyrhizobium sp. SRL28]|nr:hypothetical protein [Bradyrhizobium sp. SRL28]